MLFLIRVKIVSCDCHLLCDAMNSTDLSFYVLEGNNISCIENKLLRSSDFVSAVLGLTKVLSCYKYSLTFALLHFGLEGKYSSMLTLHT